MSNYRSDQTIWTIQKNRFSFNSWMIPLIVAATSVREGLFCTRRDLQSRTIMIKTVLSPNKHHYKLWVVEFQLNYIKATQTGNRQIRLTSTTTLCTLQHFVSIGSSTLFSVSQAQKHSPNYQPMIKRLKRNKTRKLINPYHNYDK